MCSRRVDALKLWVALQRYGAAGIGALYDHLCSLAQALHRMIGERRDFEALHEPESNILCFRWLPAGDRRTTSSASALNLALRERYNASGRGWITSTVLDGTARAPRDDDESADDGGARRGAARRGSGRRAGYCSRSSELFVAEMNPRVEGSMRRMLLARALSLVLLVASAAVRPVIAQVAGAASDTAAVRAFVQQFYDWYLPQTNVEVAIRDRPNAFAPELYRALKADDDAQTKEPAVIVGLDFDPFTASQDPCARYEARQIMKKGTSYEVDVVAQCDGKWDDHPSVVAKVERQGGTWVFADFRYPHQPDGLLTTLKRLKKDRERK